MRGKFFLGLAILITTISIGCGGGSMSNHAVAASELAVSPPTLDFGQVEVGSVKHQTGTLTAGDSSITVTSADWSGEGYSVSGIVFPLTVRAGQSVRFNIAFAPNRTGGATGKISFQSDAEHATQAVFHGKGAISHSVTLAWHPTASSAIGYNVYRGAASKGPFAKINGAVHPKTKFVDATVAGGKTYFYMTTAVSKNGKESKPSNRVQVTIPSNS
jgi:hypothetical protein